MGSTVPCGAQLGQGSKNPTTNSVGDLRSPEEFGAALRSKPILRGKLSCRENDVGRSPESSGMKSGVVDVAFLTDDVANAESSGMKSGLERKAEPLAELF